MVLLAHRLDRVRDIEIRQGFFMPGNIFFYAVINVIKVR